MKNPETDFKGDLVQILVHPKAAFNPVSEPNLAGHSSPDSEEDFSLVSDAG